MSILNLPGRATGEILDTDDVEAWIIEAYSVTNPTFADQPIDTYVICGGDIPAGGVPAFDPTQVGNDYPWLAGTTIQCDATTTVDGEATQWDVEAGDSCNAPIRSIAVYYIGNPQTPARGVGLGFDNFDANAGAACPQPITCCPPLDEDIGDLYFPDVGSNGEFLIEFDPSNSTFNQNMQTYFDFIALDPSIERFVIYFGLWDWDENTLATDPPDNSGTPGIEWPYWALIWDASTSGSGEPIACQWANFTTVTCTPAPHSWPLFFNDPGQSLQWNNRYHITALPAVRRFGASSMEILPNCPMVTTPYNFTKGGNKRGKDEIVSKSTLMDTAKFLNTPAGREFQRLLERSSEPKRKSEKRRR